MDRKIIAASCVLMFLLSMLSVMFEEDLILAYANGNESETLGIDLARINSGETVSSKLVGYSGPDLSGAYWPNVFNRRLDAQQDEAVESYSQNSRDRANWNFSEITEWGDLAYVNGSVTRLVVGFNGEGSRSLLHIERAVMRYQAKIVNKIFINGEIKAVVVELPLASVTEFVDEVRVSGFAGYIEPNMKFQMSLVPNDPYWNMQWGPQKIGADWAWNKTFGSHDVLVAVVDTGIFYYHEDLAANYVALGYDWVNMDDDPLDDNGHGTHCAGIIAAVLNNGMGIAGLAQVRIMAEKVLTSGGWGYADWIASGIIHAAESGARIISMSLGGYGYSELLHEAVKYAYERGVLLIAAAGNDNTNMKLYPAGFDEVIAVAATEQYDNKAWFSNWGDWIELAAPGVDVYSTVPSGYTFMSGTSMACPHVSGVAALVWSIYPNKTRDWVRLWLRYVADDLGDPGFDFYYGYGRINARRALEQAPPVHELIAYGWATPPYVKPGATGIINATVLNFGENDETNVVVQLLANNSIVDSVSIDFLPSGGSSRVCLTWNPMVKGIYNVTIYVVPVQGETNVENNELWKFIYVGFPVKAVVLHSAGNFYSDIITNWQVLSSEWHLFGDTMIYVDYTTLNKDGITYEDIAKTEADVLIISCAYDPYAGWEFTDSEIEAIKQYVYEGHGLIVTAGTFYYQVPNNNKLAPLLGLNETVVWTATGTDLLHLINTTHPLFNKVPNPLVFPQVGTALPYDGRWDQNELVDGKYLALGHYQESAIAVRRGLVYISPWLEVIPPYYHHHLQLLYNAIVWSRYKKPQHELVVSLQAPKYLQPGGSALLNATISNMGLNNETNVELQLLIDGELADSIIIPELPVGASYKISYCWTPVVEKNYNITAYSPPVPGEEFTDNNIVTKFVRVMIQIRVAVLGDYYSQLTKLLMENGILAQERGWDIIYEIQNYDAVVLNRPGDPGRETFMALLEAADRYCVGLVFTSSWPTYDPYGISLLQWYLGDPKFQAHDYGRGSVYYQVLQKHPIFEGWDAGDKVYIITMGDGDHAWFWDYSGVTVANIGADYSGVRGGGVAFKITDSGNRHLLLAGLAPQFYANIMHWTDYAKNIFVRGVCWVAARPEHDIAVNLKAPEYLEPGGSAVFNVTAFNRGLRNETDVELQLIVNGQVVRSEVIPEIIAGASYTIAYVWIPPCEGTYNITAYALPVKNETLIFNNKAAKIVKVAHPLIRPIEGQYANYTIYYIDPSTGSKMFGGLWNLTYLRYISPYQMNVTIWGKDPSGYTQRGWMVVNTFTRMVEADSGIGWAGMWYPGWIETNVAVGSVINLLWGNATVVDSRVVLVNGVPIDCWEAQIIDTYLYNFWFDKASGLWIGMQASSPRMDVYLILTATNVPIGFKYEHDVAVMLEAPRKIQPGTSTILNATVFNVGLNNETGIVLQLLINNQITASEVVPELMSGAYYTLSYPWTPHLEGTYNLTAYSPPFQGEEYIENNVKTRMVNVQSVSIALISDHSELMAVTYILDSMGINYNVYNDNNVHLYTSNLQLLLNYKVIVFYTDYRWITPEEQTALNSYLSLGGNLIVTGYDCLVSDYRLADVVRSATLGDNTGRPDLYVVNPSHPIMNGPYGSYPAGYHVKDLFSDCDKAKADTARGAVTVAELGDGYDKIISTEALPGKVVFWNGRGDLDWTWSIECQIMFKNMISWMIIKPEHDLTVSLQAPATVKVGEKVVLKATVVNGGLHNETGVELRLMINNVVVRSETILELPTGESYTIAYSWTPTIEGVYNVTAYAPPLDGEFFTVNNKATKIVYVGLPPGITIVYVSPSSINTVLGESFIIKVNVANITNLWGYEFKLFYSKTVLSCVNLTLPPGHLLEPKDPNNLFLVRFEFNNEYNSTHGRIWVAMTLLHPEQPKSGSGVLVAVTFQAVGKGVSILHLSGTKFANDSAEPIPHVTINGEVVVSEPGALRDVAITSVIAPFNETYMGWNLQIWVTAANLGNFPETFNVTAYYNSNIIGTQTVNNLAPGQTVLLTFNLDTSKLEPYINYTIWAEASPVQDEINTGNNVYINGLIRVKILGDVNGDKIVDLYDLVSIGGAFGAEPGNPTWKPNADINRDGIVDLYDLVIIAIHFGETYP